MNTPKTIQIANLHPFEGHPYQVRDDAEMDTLVESLQEHGILTPLIVRPLEDTPNEYEVISGHRRLHAAQKAGISEVPAFVHAVSRDEAAIQLVDSNLHREHILPSEKAFAYKMKYEAMRHQGTSSQLGTKLRSDEEMAAQVGESRNQIQRYIRLTNLIPPLLTLMDEGRIAFTVGVELSYLSNEEQRAVLEAIELYDCTPSYSQACRMHRESEAGDVRNRIEAILAEEKPNQREKVSFQYEQLRRYFPSDYTPKQMTESILQLLERERRRRLDRGAR